MPLCWNTLVWWFVLWRYACSMELYSSNGLSNGTSESVQRWKRCIQLVPAVWPQLFQVTQEHVPAQPCLWRWWSWKEWCCCKALPESSPGWPKAFSHEIQTRLCAACPSQCNVDVAWVKAVQNETFHIIIHTPPTPPPPTPLPTGSYHISAETVLINTIKMLSVIWSHCLAIRSGAKSCELSKHPLFCLGQIFWHQS